MAILEKKTEAGKKSAVKKTSTKNLYPEKKETTEAKTDANRKFGNAYKVLIKPLITEKASVLNAESKYIFEVANGSNKIEVAKAIKEVYGIQPVNVNMIKVLGKNTRHGKTLGKRKDWKKAIVTLPKGQSIKIYEGV